MVERRVCTFCGDEIEPGTGRMYVKKDGVVFNLCSSKCYKNLIILGRVPRRTTWTRYYEREKEVRMKGLPVAEEAPKARKLKKEKAEPAREEEKGKTDEGPKAEEKPEKAAEEKKAAPVKKQAAKAPAKKPSSKKVDSAKKDSEENPSEEAEE